MPVKCLNGYLYSIVVPEKAHGKLCRTAQKLGISVEAALEQILRQLGETDEGAGS